jgi:hypothetical protein
MDGSWMDIDLVIDITGFIGSRSLVKNLLRAALGQVEPGPQCLHRRRHAAAACRARRMCHNARTRCTAAVLPAATTLRD